MAFALLDHTEEKTTIDEILTGTFREKDRQINFAINELEKIRAEIKELAFLFDDLSPDKELVVDLDNIEEVFNNHITELKGENNETN